MLSEEYVSTHWKNSVYSDGSDMYVSNPAPAIGDQVGIRLRILDGAPITGIYLCYIADGRHDMAPMVRTRVENGLAYYEAGVPITQNTLKYSFYLLGENSLYSYTQKGLADYMQNECYMFTILADYVQPAWVKDAVFYQIFPERFYNGDKSNDVKDGEITKMGHASIQVKDWNQPAGRYNDVHCMDFYGGDLQGIREKIPYLKELGVTALYINPIFNAPSVHKYDCIDYESIDPHFGGDEALAELSQALHENGMKLVLDISVNHTGTDHKWFNKDGLYYPMNQGAYNNPDSEERGYYAFHEDGSYNTWRGNVDLAQLNYKSEQLKDRIYRAEDSILKKWLKPPYSIDGWRFDVADVMAKYGPDQLDHEVWTGIRQAVREVNPDAYVLAEEWGECADYLQGDMWDSTMNYYACCRVWRAFIGVNDWVMNHIPDYRRNSHKYNARQAREQMTDFLARIPFALQQVLFNLIDSHDIDRLHNNNVNEDEYRGTVIGMMTMIGCPNIYYGDEANCDGRVEDTEGCRFPMPWDSGFEDSDRYRFYRDMIALRKSHRAFSDGAFQIIYTEGQVFAFARYTADECFLSIIASEDADSWVSLPVGVLGVDAGLLSGSGVDELGTGYNCEADGTGILRLKVEAHKSYVIRLK